MKFREPLSHTDYDATIELCKSQTAYKCVNNLSEKSILKQAVEKLVIIQEPLQTDFEDALITDL